MTRSVTSSSASTILSPLNLVELLVGVRAHPIVIGVLEMADHPLDDAFIVVPRVPVAKPVPDTDANDEEQDVPHEGRVGERGVVPVSIPDALWWIAVTMRRDRVAKRQV
jgi:hypothetical protein